MANSSEFPGSCSTNTIILQDFGEVAYIVCTVAAPPTNHALQIATNESTLARLRRTETQFREASILAALDVSSLQLFTFYKKVDVMRDQRTLLSKFTNILRTNSCTIAYKAAARAPDLLKAEPEKIKLHRLYILAILASIEIPSQANREILSLGRRYYAVGPDTSADVEMHFPPCWSLVRIDLQVVITGHVLLTLASSGSGGLFRFSDLKSQLKNAHKAKQNSIPVVLAPFGHLASYNGGWIGSRSDTKTSLTELEPEMIERFNKWKQLLAQWTKADPKLSFVDDDEAQWVELQLPGNTQEGIPDIETQDFAIQNKMSINFSPMFWPAALCFRVRTSLSSASPERFNPEDPIRFIEEWAKNAKDRHAVEEAERKHDSSESEDLLFDEDNQDVFPTFGPPGFPQSQNVYPTPPDVIMTHTTPGRSSIDGLAMTPANAPRAAGTSLQNSSQDFEMTDVGSSHVAAVGSGYYDEDLFEEMPEDTFGQTGTGDEPNWDFFDKPGMDVDDAERDADAHDPSIRHQTPNDKLDSKADLKTEVADVKSSSESPPHEVETLQAEKTIHIQSPIHGGQEIDESEPFPDLMQSPLIDQTTASSWQQLGEQDREPVLPRPDRRRSSIYEVTRPSKQSNSQDSRYKTQGDFWFDSPKQQRLEGRETTLAGWTRRTPSSSSASDSSADQDEMSFNGDQDRPGLSRQWTRYEAAAVQEDEPSSQIDTAAIERETMATFDLLKTKSATLSLEHTATISKKPQMGIPKDKPGLSLIFSQLLVEQYSQSTLAQSAQRDKAAESEHNLPAELFPSLTNMNANAVFANVNQLSSLGSISAAQTSLGRIAKLPERQITFKRGEKDMLASISILPFWDTLGLQPKKRTKDVTAFCIHPPGFSTTDGCTNFMERLADAYSNCSLGTHKPGKVANLTNTGLLAWTVEEGKPASPVSIAMRLGEAIGPLNELTGTVVVYILALSAEPSSYLQCCGAFYACYQSFRKHTLTRSEKVELILQVLPATFVASPETVVVPCQSQYNSLALEVYSRIPPPDFPNQPGVWDFPIVLADDEQSVQFSLETASPSPFSKDGTSLHLAYSYSDDQRWIVACWTDGTGAIALTLTYLLKATVGDKGRPEKDVVQDMWEVSQGLMRKQRTQWRLIVSRVGFYHVAQENAWIHVANAEASDDKSLCTLQLLSLELKPTLRICPSTLTTKTGPSQASTQGGTYGTPASTPQAITTSPEQIIPATPTPGGTSAANAPTPPEHGFDANIDGDLSLIDLSQESWAVILPFGVSQSHDILGARPSREHTTSGYLLKRLGLKDEDGAVSLGVHLIYASSSAPGLATGEKEDILEDVICQYRALSILAVARGCIDKSKQCIPWHIHIAVAGARGLSGVI